MSQSELLNRVVATLEASQTPYMLTGSLASSLQGEPRLTHDIDLVVAINATGVRAIADAFPEPDYFFDVEAASAAVARRGEFNLIDIVNGDKVDFWLLTEDSFDQSRFERRYQEQFEGIALYVSRPEDTILMKLRWAEMSGGSEKQFGDAKSIYELQSQTLDLAYMEQWAGILQIEDLWQRLRRETSK